MCIEPSNPKTHTFVIVISTETNKSDAQKEQNTQLFDYKITQTDVTAWENGRFILRTVWVFWDGYLCVVFLGAV